MSNSKCGECSYPEHCPQCRGPSEINSLREQVATLTRELGTAASELSEKQVELDMILLDRDRLCANEARLVERLRYFCDKHSQHCECGRCDALANTDATEWLRAYGMRVAWKAVVECQCGRWPHTDADVAAIIDGVKP